MNIYLECLLIGLISTICCHLSYHLINDKNKKINKSLYTNNIILCFIIGALLHYLIKKNNICDMYCRKVCYNDECFMVCPI